MCYPILVLQLDFVTLLNGFQTRLGNSLFLPRRKSLL